MNRFKKDSKNTDPDMYPPSIPKPQMGEDPKTLGVEMGSGEEDSVNNRLLDTDDSSQEEQKQDHSHNLLDADAHHELALQNHKEMMDGIDQKHSVEEHLNAAIDNNKEMLSTMGEEDLPNGDEMEDNVSRPEGYDEEQAPSDMGLSEDEDSPDLTEVLKGGLDSHAESIKRDKIVDMVGQALEGFKANKQILERAKEKAPELYDSCIAMLRAMIEMSKMLGLGEEQNPLEDEQQGTGQEDSSNIPGSEHPQEEAEDKIGDYKEENREENSTPNPYSPGDFGQDATEPNAGEQQTNKEDEDRKPVGKPIGKLPTSHSSPHVAKTPIPIGAVNSKGQIKVEDKDGTIRWVDRKKGNVLSPEGVPVQPNKK
jgi:hypothetical protein